jgi:hypothetical protein
MYAALAGNVSQPGMFDWICTWGAGDGAERGVYADFLDETAVLFNKPALKAVGQQFRKAAEAWCALADALLPESIALFKEARELKLRKNALFIQKGGEALDEIRAINTQLESIRQHIGENFPLSAAETAQMREELRERILKIHDLEREAVEALQAAI